MEVVNYLPAHCLGTKAGCDLAVLRANSLHRHFSVKVKLFILSLNSAMKSSHLGKVGKIELETPGPLSWVCQWVGDQFAPVVSTTGLVQA